MSLIVFAPMIYLNDEFLWNAITGVALNTSQNVLLVFIVYHYLLIISLVLDKAGLYVTKKEIMFSSTVSVIFEKADLFRYPFSTNRKTSHLNVFISIKFWKNKFQCLAVRNTHFYWVRTHKFCMITVLTNDWFFLNLLFVGNCYGLYELRCQKNSIFSLEYLKSNFS